MDQQPLPWTVEFYVTPRGERVIEDFIDALAMPMQAKIYDHLRLLREFGTHLSVPHVRSLSGHKPLWELRPLPHRLIYFAHTGRRFIILHIFRKRGNKTPAKDIETAERRMREFLGRAK